MARHLLVALMDKGFKPDILSGILGALNHQDKNGQTMILAKLVKEDTGNSSRHTSERHNIGNPVEALLSLRATNSRISSNCSAARSRPPSVIAFGNGISSACGVNERTDVRLPGKPCAANTAAQCPARFSLASSTVTYSPFGLGAQ